MNSKIYNTQNLKETQSIAEELAKSLKGGEILCLFGDLGSGKTTFIQGLAKGLGVKQRIISPSFLIIRNYELGTMNKKFDCFYHIDLYRIQTKNDIQGLGIEEIINNKKNVVAIEWAEKLKTLPKKRIEIHFEYVDENKRKIIIKSHE